ncbi:uncharacterized SAM-binding protein YcdF (DUF218 family) [Roseiarcus fermentans]|uniref:Uncharacterized SAM-binding protein YcdF (DUF218 family) n=1 Tax=Roseiarcus fermentans TaxID=1473586 RepID=A0A366F1U1_9HYPH|nr:YdcF family protein [Roseiarcus fermentans]RBP08564.1 uncharacterized SAM-binding protein YcdF (DUF218 family) [Roseiarcus fermentans]
MFFTLSKIYESFLSPLPLLILLTLVGAILTATRAARFGRALAAVAALALLVLALTPVGRALIAPLEDRFSSPAASAPAPYGVIVLGGAIKGAESRARGQAVFDEGERLVEAAILARRYPDARIVFTGGDGSLLPGHNVEAQEARKLLIELGVDPARVTLEERSRNTDENARFTAAMVHPEPGQRWLLVTSAFHMPRSMGLFEKAGFDVAAFPVAFRTLGPGQPLLWSLDAAENLRTFATAAKEWIGLAAYRATGRIDRLFPGPDDRAPRVSG